MFEVDNKLDAAVLLELCDRAQVGFERTAPKLAAAVDRVSFFCQPLYGNEPEAIQAVSDLELMVVEICGGLRDKGRCANHLRPVNSVVDAARSFLKMHLCHYTE